MYHKLASWLRRLADWLSPEHPAVQELMPLARLAVAKAEPSGLAGSIKWLAAMKFMEKQTTARRRHINAAIDRAVLELDGDRHGG